MLYGAHGSFSSGTSGVLGYYIPSIGKTLCVMWFDPYVGPNTWNIAFYDGVEKPHSDIYKDLHDHGAMGPGEPGEEGKHLGSGLKVTGGLSSSRGRATLEIHVKSNIPQFRKTSKHA